MEVEVELGVSACIRVRVCVPQSVHICGASNKNVSNYNLSTSYHRTKAISTTTTTRKRTTRGNEENESETQNEEINTNK